MRAWTPISSTSRIAYWTQTKFSDGLHLTSIGYEVLAKHLIDVIEKVEPKLAAAKVPSRMPP
mgnify:FL=1